MSSLKTNRQNKSHPTFRTPLFSTRIDWTPVRWNASLPDPGAGNQLLPPGELDEVLEQLQADLLALLGVELCGEDVVAPNRGSEGLAVDRAGGDDGGIRRLGEEAVDEIDVAAAGNA